MNRLSEMKMNVSVNLVYRTGLEKKNTAKTSVHLLYTVRLMELMRVETLCEPHPAFKYCRASFTM